MKATYDEVLEKLEEIYRFDMLCPKCGGPIEHGRTVHCKKCATKGDVSIWIENIEQNVNSIKGLYKLRKVPVHRLEQGLPTEDDIIVGGDLDEIEK